MSCNFNVNIFSLFHLFPFTFHLLLFLRKIINRQNVTYKLVLKEINFFLSQEKAKEKSTICVLSEHFEKSKEFTFLEGIFTLINLTHNN